MAPTVFPMTPEVPGAPFRRIKVMLLTVGLGVGGTEGQVLEIASRLDRRRFEVSVCALKGADVLAHELRARGVRVITLDGKGAWDARVLYRLARVIRAERPDVIHAFLFWANCLSRVLGRLLRVPVLISSYRDILLWARWGYRVCDRVTAGWAQAATCCSEAVRRLALAEVGGDARTYVTIHNGVDVARFSSSRTGTRADVGLRDGVPVIGTVGRLIEPEKGITVLLQGVARLAGPPAPLAYQLLIVGDGPARGQLHALVERLGISSRVVFAGMRRDIADVLPLVDVFVMPSLSEGFGIAIVEAMAAGLPVVASDVGGIPEIVRHGETGLLVPPGDPAALAAALRELVTRPDRARALGACGRQRARERFSIESAVKRHEDLYSDLMAQRLNPPTCA